MTDYIENVGIVFGMPLFIGFYHNPTLTLTLETRAGQINSSVDATKKKKCRMGRAKRYPSIH